MRLDEDEMQIRRDRIIEIAFQLFCKYGIEQVPIGQIAEQSGIGKRTMCRYFHNKMNLVMDVLIDQWEKLIDTIRKNIGFYTIYPLLNGCEQIALWLQAFRQIYENYASLILFSCEIKRNAIRNKACFFHKRSDFFTHGIREPCVAALEKGRMDGTLSFSYSSTEVFYAMWASIQGCIASGEERNSYKNTCQVMEETIMNALRSK